MSIQWHFRYQKISLCVLKNMKEQKKLENKIFINVTTKLTLASKQKEEEKFTFSYQKAVLSHSFTRRATL